MLMPLMLMRVELLKTPGGIHKAFALGLAGAYAGFNCDGIVRTIIGA